MLGIKPLGAEDIERLMQIPVGSVMVYPDRKIYRRTTDNFEVTYVEPVYEGYSWNLNGSHFQYLWMDELVKEKGDWDV